MGNLGKIEFICWGWGGSLPRFLFLAEGFRAARPSSEFLPAAAKSKTLEVLVTWVLALCTGEGIIRERSWSKSYTAVRVYRDDKGHGYYFRLPFCKTL